MAFATSTEQLLNRFLVSFFASRSPVIVHVREFVRSHQAVRQCARASISIMQRIARLPQIFLRRPKTPADPRLEAVLAARAIGGTIAVPELEEIWRLARKGRRVLCAAEGLERDQIAVMLDAAGASAKFVGQDDLESDAIPNPDEFGLVIAAPCPPLERQIAVLREKTKSLEKFVLVGAQSKPSVYGQLNARPAEQGFLQRNEFVRTKLAAGEPLSVVFLNDVGFQYGAGIALKRQVASLLLNGWDVSVVSWSPGEAADLTFVTGVERFDNWHGVHGVRDAKGPDAAAAAALAKVRTFNPDVVITGNLHGARWPLGLLRNLKSRGICVVAYMHDVHLVTGRCAYPMSCGLFRSGCNADCPTFDEHPRLAPEKIAPAWHERSKLFTGPERIPLVGNSTWTCGIAAERFGATAIIELVHLGLDHEMFAPIPKSVARRLLNIPGDKPIIVMGAVDVHNQWKGGPMFHELLEILAARDDVHVIVFGRASEDLPCLKAFGLVRDERMMPLILNAGDIYVSTANAEAFGQSVLEASACTLPVVAFDVGGVRDAIVNNETGILVGRQTLTDLLAAIERLLQDPAERETLGRNGRRRVESKFTLNHQADAWVDCLRRIC